MKPVFLFLTVIFTTNFGSVAQDIPDSTRIIFTKDQPVLFDLVPSAGLPRFTPATAETDSASIFLSNYLVAGNKAEYQELRSKPYYRQYAGFIIDEKRMIFINASCKKNDYFEKNTFYPRGGGSCYYRALVDMREKKIVTLLVNGPK